MWSYHLSAMNLVSTYRHLHLTVTHCCIWPTASRIANNFALKADELANKWEALVIKKGGKFECSTENLGVLEIQVPRALLPLLLCVSLVAQTRPLAADSAGD